ncbi:MAG TPA: hypothetical protein VKU01_20700 [Bryobacteraceae bacterium]|nr:hypothetical protein [Bryobacteraceae bacterium]
MRFRWPALVLVAAVTVVVISTTCFWWRSEFRPWIEVLAMLGEWGVVIVIYLEFEGARRGRQAEAVLAVLQELRTEASQEARRYILRELPPDTEGLDVEEIRKHLDCIHHALISFHRAGFMLESSDIDERLRDHIMVFVWATASRCWMKCNKFIEYEAKRRTDDSCMVYFGRLFEMCEAYRQRHDLPVPQP